MRSVILSVLFILACSSPALPTARGIVFVHAPAGELAAVVLVAQKDATTAGRKLLVYSGATWCQPCQAFHHAVDAGQLADFSPALTLLELDRDADEDRLRAGGYITEYVPLFALPGADGKSSGHFSEGATKDGDYVAELRQRLARLTSGDGR